MAEKIIFFIFKIITKFVNYVNSFSLNQILIIIVNNFKKNKKINQLYNNCAGKHLAMITLKLLTIMNNYNTKLF